MMDSDRILVGCSVKAKNSEHSNLETEYLFKTISEFGGELANAKKIACFKEEPNSAIKENLRTYLGQFRMMTDAVNIKSAFVINIGMEFEIITRPNYNANEVILRCINYIKNRFDNDKMSINEPIMLSNIYSEMDNVEGVQSVVDIEITNKYDTNDGYSGHVYDIPSATKNRIIYPSLDPCIFEIKYPNKDIKGRTVTF